MAGVFLSYDRRDTARAKPIASALERAGHEVWWDLHVRGGAQFAKVIEEALKHADVVVVLWSSNSVESAWVRDEAAFGRDSGRLVPIQIDGVETPLGFRQFQNLNFIRWTGRSRSKEIQQLRHAIDEISGKTAPNIVLPARQADGPKVSRLAILTGLAIAAVLAVIFAVSRLSDDRSSVPRIAVEAAETSAPSQALARDLFVKLGQLQAANPEALVLSSNDAGERADFTFEVSASQNREAAVATVAMLASDRTLLWSKDFERPLNRYADLKQQLAFTAARVLDCAAEGVTDNDAKLDHTTLKLYLSGCANLSDLAWNDFRALVPMFKEVTERAPRFDDGWAKLLVTEAFVIGWETVPTDSPEGHTLKKDIAIARKLDPRMPEAYWAEYMLVGEFDLMKAAEVYERAVRENPNNLEVLAGQVPFLRRVGRLKEAVSIAKREVGHDPLDPTGMAGYVEVLTYAGQVDAALKELEKAQRIWPGTRPLIEARYRYYSRYGDPKEALRIIRSGVNPDYAGLESLTLARIDPSQENVDRALADARAEVGQNPRSVARLVLALAQFGREEEIFPIIEGPSGKKAIYLSDALFRPEFKTLRQNPRFMKAAKNLGLVDYWRKSGKWPDFCFEAGLPYDCKVEAARLAA